ncbi:General transcription factor IIH subunit 4 [Acropora cervicornis]|uniref:General transcription factor IIH subunit 4 n=1 Tax=Acropora cervicornis TaxID=6130 RepID=A0AAD9QTF8_ACRCE|nr:General transcription factor IIH subunit 4 [Acropora cervicornis]
MAANSLSGSSFFRHLQCRDLHQYLGSLASGILDRLYNHPAICLAVFRELPELAKQFVMRTLFAEQPVPETLVAAWVKSDHQKPYTGAMNRLKSLRIWREASGGVPNRLEMNAIFRSNLKIALCGGETPGSTPVISPAGFQFLLMDTASQVWYFMLQYLETIEGRDMDLVECLSFLFQISFETLGKDYSTEGMSESQFKFLQHLREFGLVFQRKRKSRRYYPTRLAINLASAGIGSSAVTHSDEKGFIVVETNYRLYAYTDSSFLAYASPSRDAKEGNIESLTPVIPPTISDQIRLWELERSRMKFTEGVLYNQFLSQADFEILRKYAEDLGVLMWANSSKRVIVVSRSGHDDVKRFWKRQKQNT